MRAAATMAAVLLVIASAGFGTAFAWTMGAHHGPALAACAVAMALGLELAKPFACEAVLDCARRLAIGRALAMLALAVVAICYSLTAELSLMATTRGDAAAERTKVGDTVKDARAELARLLAERSAMPSTSPATGETVDAAREAVKAAERTRAAECDGGKAKARGSNCRSREGDEAAARQKLSEAIADKAATDRAAKLDADAARVRARLATASPVAAAADPGAVALGGLLGSFGLTVPTTLVAQWLTLVGVIALEVGSALSVMLVRAAGAPVTRPVVDVSADSRADAQPRRRQTPSATAGKVSKASPKRSRASRGNAPATKPERTASGGRRGQRVGASGKAATLGQSAGGVSKASAAKARIVDTLKDAGGKLDGATVRALAKGTGAKRSTVHNALAALVGAGIVAKVGAAGLVLT